MPRRALLTFVPGALALALALACGNSGSESGPTKAGSVTAVSGTVTALRGADGSRARTLAVGDVVFSDDTITTAPTAAITIALSHNGARWTLGGDTARRVDRSAAWRAPTGSDEATFVAGDPDRTASAGRHTETAPQTERAASAAPAEPAVAAPAEPAVAAPAADLTRQATVPSAAPPPPPSPPPKKAKKKQQQRPRGGRRPVTRVEHIGATDDLSDGLTDDDQVDERDLELTPLDIANALEKVAPAVRKCGEEHGARGVLVKVKILIARDGSVSGAVPMGDHAKTDLGRCVATRVRAARFPENAGPPSVIHPFKM